MLNDENILLNSFLEYRTVLGILVILINAPVMFKVNAVAVIPEAIWKCII